MIRPLLFKMGVPNDYSDWRIRYEQDLGDDLLVYGQWQPVIRPAVLMIICRPEPRQKLLRADILSLRQHSLMQPLNLLSMMAKTLPITGGLQAGTGISRLSVTFNASAFHYDYQDYGDDGNAVQ